MEFLINKIYRFSDRTKEVVHPSFCRISFGPNKYVYNINTKFLVLKIETRKSTNEFRDTNFLDPVSYTFVTLLDLFTLDVLTTTTHDLRFTAL